MNPDTDVANAAAKEDAMISRHMGVLASLACLLAGPTAASAVELVGMDHFAINVHDVQKSADWYQRILGFTVLHKWDNAWMVGRGNIKIGLFIEPNAAPMPSDLNSQLMIRKIAFLVDGDKFLDTINELKSKGITVSAPEDTGIAYSVFINDPDGYLLEFTTFHGSGPPPGLP